MGATPITRTVSIIVTDQKPALVRGDHLRPLRMIFAMLGVAFTGITVAACGQDSAIADCTQRGISYFKEIESWPNLSDGRDAATLAAERCQWTLTAFL